MGPIDPRILRLLCFFNHHHLPEKLQGIAKPYYDLAHRASSLGIDVEETLAGLRKLLEAKDCAVRSVLPETEPVWPQAKM